MAEAKRNEAAEGREIEPGSFRDQEDKLFEAGHMELGDFWGEKTGAAKQEAADFKTGIAYDVTQLQTRYDNQLTPSERANADSVANEAAQAAADMQAAGEVDIANLQSVLGKIGAPIQLTPDMKINRPIQLTPDMVINPADPHVISSEPERVEADLGDVIPDKPAAEVHDVRAELTTPPPDAAERYRAMSLAELQDEYDRLFAKTEADLKANPAKLKAYKKALKTGVLPEDPEAENADINKVYAEIQARRRPNPEASAPAVVEKPVVQPPPPPPARVEAPVATARPEPIVAPARAYEAKEDAGFDSTVAKYQKTFEGQHTEGDLVGLLSTLENRTPEDMLTDAEIAGTLTKDDVRAVIEANKIEEFKYAAVAHLTKLLEQAKLATKPAEAPVVAAAERPRITKKKTTGPKPAKSAAVEAPVPARAEKSSFAESLLMHAARDKGPDKAEKVIDTVYRRIGILRDELAKEVPAKMAGLSAEEKLNMLDQLRGFVQKLDDPAFLHHALAKDLEIQDDELKKLSTGDLGRIADDMREYYQEAIRLANKNIGA